MKKFLIPILAVLVTGCASQQAYNSSPSLDPALAKDQYKHGLNLFYGEGVNKDYGEAKKLLLESAGQGNADAQYALGWMYAEGLGGTKDDTEALRWFNKSAEQGNIEAQSAINVYKKSGGIKTYAETAQHLQQRAEKGDASSQHMLAIMYYYGLGVNQDRKKAEEWLSKSTRSNSKSQTISKAVCGTLSDLLLDINSRPQKECIYQNTPTGGVMAFQVTASGILAQLWGMPPEAHLKMIYIFKGEGARGEIVDGAMLPPGYFKYVGPYTYQSPSGERTVYSFRPVK